MRGTLISTLRACLRLTFTQRREPTLRVVVPFGQRSCATAPAVGTGLQEGVLVVRVDGQRVRTLGEWCAATADRNAIAVDFVLPSGQTGSARLRAY